MNNSLIDGIKRGDRRAVARFITIIENNEAEKDAYMAEIYPMTGRAFVLGITGSPGAGKSSLVESLITELRKQGRRVGVIAVDPTSPFTGGALLGDRVRMQKHTLDPGVYIRSMGSRGRLGGIAQATGEAVMVLDAFGMDVVIVETVGVGQSEVDIMNIADTTLVVLTPGAGDTIQTIKAGIMEIADIFVINKADLPGAHGVMSQVRNMLDMQDFGSRWRPLLVAVSNINKTGITELLDAVEQHIRYQIDKDFYQARRKDKFLIEAAAIIEEKIKYKTQLLVRSEIEKNEDNLRLNPYELAEKILKELNLN